MRKIILAALAALTLVSLASCHKYKYETVKGDPLKTKIYTLDNGLKVYMSVNKETPRLQTYIAVKVGSKNDPHETTGLSHYLEHLMFKGSESFGTSDYEAEKPLLDSIRALFEVYRTKTDPAERIALYHKIDSISYEASKIAIPNEYDKLMSIIGASGTNAFTSNDMTVYTEDIPSNEIDNWAKIEADRFRHPVIRGFHTELEAVYEEKNMSLTEDQEKAMEAIDSVLFTKHPYGLQTTLGTQEHLKNPSIINIENHRNNFYVPNNIAICVSGDFDPDTFVATIEKYFGDWEPNPDIKTLQYEEEAPITAPVEKNVYGLDAEFVMVGWRTPGEKDFLRSEVGDLVSSILSNGKAGIADLDLIQAQKVNSFFGFNYTRPDYGEFLLFGYPRAGQSLEEVRELMLEEIAKLRAGDFDDELIQATINNYKLSKMRQLERNGNRAMAFVNSFINEHNWKDDALQMKRLEKVTKQQIVDWANEYLGANSHVTAYKRLGVDKNIDKIAAPAITPIETNRDKQSAFLKDIQQTEVKPIDPVFLDFSKDMKKGEISGLEFLYKKNELNDIATLFCTFDKGTQNDPRLDIAFRYLDYLGTPDRSAEQIKKELYNLACNERYSAGPLQSNIGVTGLDENVGKAMAIVEDLIFNAVADTNILAEVKSDILKNRADEKLSQSGCFSALQRYIFYGPEFIGKNTLTNEQVLALTSDELLQAVRDLYGKKHDILYYGPSDEGAARKIIADCHKVSDNPEALEKEIPQDRRVEKSEVFIAPYDANQFYYLQYSNDGNKFDVANDPSVTMYNNYFGSGMNAIVFQEMREARGLAYSARAFLRTPSFKESDYSFYAFIASQNDKLREAVEAFDKIINDMPESPEAFEVAKTAVLNNLRTNRTTGISVLYDYLDLKDLGLTEDRDKAVFEKIQNMTLEDVKAFQQKWIKDRKYVYGLLGRESDFDMDFVRSLGPVTELTLEEIFGY
ncbi:MAG: insulinase family protein [Bacteroidales bacterium]|nr:insulinase family protein [Bacteroidales bacterium]MBR5396435.1 insulinase family protein [Bacteroidales bacterium]